MAGQDNQIASKTTRRTFKQSLSSSFVLPTRDFIFATELQLRGIGRRNFANANMQALSSQEPRFLTNHKCARRGGSFDLTRFRAFSKWVSALVMPLPVGALAGRTRPDRGVSRQAMNAGDGCCRS